MNLLEFWRLQEKPQLEFTKAFPPNDRLISPSQCLTSNVWIFPSLSFISIKTEGSSTLLRELKKTIRVMPLFMMSSKQSLMLFFLLYNALLITQIIRSTYIMMGASGAEDQDKWPSLQSYYYLRKKLLRIPGNMIMSSAPLLRKLNWLPVKQLLYLRDSNMAEKCFKQSRSDLFMRQILQTFNHP